MTNVPAVKRVMSKDHVRDDKKSKMGAPWRGAAGKDDRAAAATAAASAELASSMNLDDDDYSLGGSGGGGDNYPNYIIDKNMNNNNVTRFSSSAEVGGLVASASHRSLSQLSLAGDRSTATSADAADDDYPPGEWGGGGGGIVTTTTTTIQRRVSEDVLLGGGGPGEGLGRKNYTIHERRTSSNASAGDDSNSDEEGRAGTTVSGNWGWFEDVHGHEGPFLYHSTISKGAGGGADSIDGGTAGDGGSRGGNGRGGKKKKGLFHIGGEIMQNVMSLMEPQRQESNIMAVTAPTYVLEESISSQKLWKQTAGNRPPQPVEERAFFEQMWAQNFARSNVKYEIPVEVLTASTPISISPFNDDRFGDDGAPGGNISNYNLAATFNMNSVEDAAADPASVKAAQADVAEATLNQRLSHNGAVQMYFDPNRPKDYNLKTLGPHHHHHTLVNKKVKNANGENDLTVLVRGDNVFGTTVSKSFPRVNDRGEPADGIDTVSISIASYRVVESKKHGKYAQYLVIFCDGNFRNTVGVWKRYSDFSELSRKVTQGDKSCAAVVTGLSPLSVDDHDAEILPNAATSWRLLKKRQRWYRCLDAGYLSLKVFLLERFLHDILFESSNPQILRDFVGVNSSEASKLNTKG